MKTKLYLVFTAFAILSCVKTNAQANKTLSNLTSPTVINQSLLPDTDDTKTLGSAEKSWQSLYLSARLYLIDSIAMHARGAGNFFSGINAGNITQKGKYNTGIGSYALHGLVSGNYNTAVGYNSLFKNTSGSYNNASGYYALYYNSTGRDNTANGYTALYNNTTGSYNTGSGSWALYYNSNGNNNTAYGYSALWQNTSGNNNTAIGKYTMYYNTSGYSNVAVGTGALYKNAVGSRLVAIGDSALYNFAASSSNYNDGANTAVGSKTLYQNTTGTHNTAFGSEALYGNISGSYNTATGRGALTGNHTGSYNTAVGYNAIVSNAAGNYNTAIGAYAGSTMWFSEVTNSTSIGYYADAYQSNQVRIGNTSVTSIGGQVGWTTFSDGRYKKNIKENVSGLAFINSLHPITYTVDTKSLNEYFNKGRKQAKERIDEKAQAEMDRSADEAGKIVQDGFVAQEVEEAAKRLGFKFSGVDNPKSKDGLYGLRYDKFVVPLVKAVQELSKMNDDLKKQNEEQEKRIEKLELMMSAHSNNSSQSSKIISISDASLEQNAPNPFTKITTIAYTLPQKITPAQIVITDNTGKTMKQINVSGTGKGILNVDATTLSSGTYNYSLIVDGKLIGSKQMILTK